MLPLVDLATLDATALRPLEGKAVSITLPSGTRHDGLLHSIVERPKWDPALRAPFSFILDVPYRADSPREEQGIIAIEHEALGRLEVFGVPLLPKGDVAPWEVILN